MVYPRVDIFSVRIILRSYFFPDPFLTSELGGGKGWTLYPHFPLPFCLISLKCRTFDIRIIVLWYIVRSLDNNSESEILLSYIKDYPIVSFPFLEYSFMLLTTLLILAGALLLMLGDLHSNALFFDPICGGHPIFHQHVFLLGIHRFTSSSFLHVGSFPE